MDFKVNLIFLIELFFLHDRKVMTKNLNIMRKKRAFKVKQKSFSLFLKDFQLSKIVSDLRVQL